MTLCACACSDIQIDTKEAITQSTVTATCNQALAS